MKRIFDLTVVLITLPIWIPIMLMTALWVRVSVGSPVLFMQTRPGLNGRSFNIIKFRTMTDDRGEDGELLPDFQRLTSAGRLIRSLSFDELPELFNILKGEMSLVGPRPLLTEYLSLYSSRQSRRHEVRPGLTGWAQINGRNNISWTDKLEMDVWYVENRSLSLDIKILIKTFVRVISRSGVSKDGEATSDKFRGDQPLDDETS